MALTGTAATIVATTLALTATVAGGPVLAVVGTVTMVATAAMGAGMAVMGVSDATQGAMEVYNAVTGNPDPAPNLIRDTVFGDNQETYNQAEAMLSFGTTVGLTAIAALPLVITTSTSGAISYYAHLNTSGSGSESGSNSSVNGTVPEVKYPGDDPTISLGEGWEWRGPADKGSWYNPQTGETLHPDLHHPYPEGPHWDYIPYKNGPQYRIMPDGTVVPK